LIFETYETLLFREISILNYFLLALIRFVNLVSINLFKDPFGMNSNAKATSATSANVPVKTINEVNKTGQLTRPPFGPVIRTPGQQKPTQNMANKAIEQPPPPPVYQPAGTPKKDLSTAVNSIVDNLEADLARHFKRRPSGQYESCTIHFIFNLTS
jgi:hypothetical protein